MTSSEQLERRAKQTRAQIADNLSELRRRMTPGRVLDETFDYVRVYMRDGGGEFVRNFGRQISGNPLPVALMGTGILWLMVSSGLKRRDYDSGLSDFETNSDASGAFDDEYATRAVPSKASEAAERLSDFADRTTRRMRRTRESARRGTEELGERVQSATSKATSKLGEQTRAAGTRIQEGLSSATEAAQHAYEQTLSVYGKSESGARRAAAAVGDAASAAASGMARQGQTLFAYVRDEPLVLAGIGLAIGALIGTVLPRSRFEDELMGESSEDVKDRAAEAAKKQWEKGKAAADKAWEAAKHEVQEESAPAKTGREHQRETEHQRGTMSGEGGTGVPLTSEPPGQTPLVPSEHETEEESH